MHIQSYKAINFKIRTGGQGGGLSLDIHAMIIIYYTDNMIVFLSLINSKSAQEESIILNCNTTVAACLTLCPRVLQGGSPQWKIQHRSLNQGGKRRRQILIQLH